MFRSARRLVLVAVAACAIALVAASSAFAGTTWVSSSPTGGKGTGCAEPDFNGVQAAIASGARSVSVCAGTYTEQVQITAPVKLKAIGGTATLAMPAAATNSTTECDTSGGLEQKDEIAICTGGKVTLDGLTVEALIPLETCAGGLYGIFVGGGGTLVSNDLTIHGASTTLPAFEGCQHGVAIEVGEIEPSEVGHARLKKLVVDGYEKNGPTVVGAGSTMSIDRGTITGIGPTPAIGQNGLETSLGAQGTYKSVTVSGNECEVGSCGPTGEQAAGVIFYAAAPGTTLGKSTVSSNDLGIYYSSGSSTVPASPDVTVVKDTLTGNRYEGVVLEEGKASLKSLTINGTGRIGIDLYQSAFQESASESSALATKIIGQSEAAVKVESDKEPGDIPGRFVATATTLSGNKQFVINENEEAFVVEFK
jgi:hypothetical protein